MSRVGHSKGRKWWASVRGFGGLRYEVDGDTAYFASNEGARALGVSADRVRVMEIELPPPKREADGQRDPWRQLPDKPKRRKKKK